MRNRLFRDLLKAHIKEIQQRNPAFSLRSFARKTKISPGAVHEILKGQRALSPEMAKKIVSTLQLSETERASFDEAIDGTDVERILLPDEAEELIQNWKYFAILSFFELDEPVTTPEEVSRRLGISATESRKYFDYLEKFGFVTRDSQGAYQHSGQQWATRDGVPSTLLRQVHKDGLSLAENALESVPVDERDFYSLTFAGSPGKLKIAKKEIRKFCDKLERTMGRGPIESVYKLSLQLIPLDERISTHPTR